MDSQMKLSWGKVWKSSEPMSFCPCEVCVTPHTVCHPRGMWMCLATEKLFDPLC